MKFHALTKNGLFLCSSLSLPCSSLMFSVSLCLVDNVKPLRLLDLWYLNLTHPSCITHIHRHTCFSGDLLQEVQFSPPVWTANMTELQYNTHRCKAGFLICPCATLALSRRTVLRWDSGGSGWIWATAGHQSHCGIGSTRPIRHLQPVKVSVLLMPDCKSSCHGPRVQREKAGMDSFSLWLCCRVGGFCRLFFFLFFCVCVVR